MNVYATYINAGLRGSRFMGASDISSSEGVVRLTGRRMSMAQAWVRTFCYVIFVPWALLLLGTIGMVAGDAPNWPLFVVIEAVGFVVIAVGLGVGDIWVARRGRSESVDWRASDATTPERKVDSTKSLTGIADSLAYRYASGKHVLKMRVPIGPNGKLRLLALRCESHEVDTIEWLLTGSGGGAVAGK
jgi:hypothetical protein